MGYDLKIYTNDIEAEALSQIYMLAEQPAFEGCKIRIMPDVHAGIGCVIGFTADLGNKVIPNVVGVDIGCGMRVSRIGKTDIDFARLDNVIRERIPSGMSVKDTEVHYPLLDELFCRKKLKNLKWIRSSLGTLGGGNHFIEVDKDEDGVQYLVIHTGSRNLGKQVAEIYQEMAENDLSGAKEMEEEVQNLIEEYKRNNRQREIQKAVKQLKTTWKRKGREVPKALSYLEGEHRELYLHDMGICQTFAKDNRRFIQEEIFEGMGWNMAETFETIHNYIDLETNIVRKGAVSARKGEKLLIPLNMRDGCILGVGKGNDDWNQSAPHGAGRILSRKQAKKNISLEEFESSMEGIYTTSVNENTLDESPMVYKPKEEIIKNIQDTVEIVKILKPVYNFKASEIRYF